LTHDLDSIDGSSQPDRASIEGEAILATIRSNLLESYEALSTEESHRLVRLLRDYPDSCAWLLDDHLSKVLVSQIPRMVKRILRFQPIVVPAVPDAAVNAYLREAVRAYWFGLFQAAVSLARAALEHALRQRVPYGEQQRWSLDMLIEAADRGKLLAPAELQLATQVQHIANRVLHSKPCRPDEAFDALVSARGVMETLYGRA
jgi:hypothetical protein